MTSQKGTFHGKLKAISHSLTCAGLQILTPGSDRPCCFFSLPRILVQPSVACSILSLTLLALYILRLRCQKQHKKLTLEKSQKVMPKSRTSAKKKNAIVKLKIAVEKLQKSLLLGRKSSSYSDMYEEVSDTTSVPEEIEEGHFTVIAVKGNEPRRFVVPLRYLRHRTFLRLLEQAAEEYGFDHEGALTIPCRPSELERILAEQWQEEGDSDVGVNWGSCQTMVQSY